MLSNSITLPSMWPPCYAPHVNDEPMPTPYLDAPPAVVSIDLGRQLFVDDFLIESTTLRRTFHQARWHESNPLLSPQTALELNDTEVAHQGPYGDCPVACPFPDGVFFDPADGLFKMWYMAGWFDGTAHAVSDDGIHWRRPELDIEPGTNRVIPHRPHMQRDGASVWLDHEETDPDRRFKMFIFYRDRAHHKRGGEIYTSPDGVHWRGPHPVSPCGDNTTIFYNPFRQRWVYSIRTIVGNHDRYILPPGSGTCEAIYDFMAVVSQPRRRTRSYRECADLIEGAIWQPGDVVFWTAADRLDQPDPAIGEPPEVYTVTAVGYESLMFGVFGMFKGPQNKTALEQRTPKTIDLEVAFSRDGFHWHRPTRTPFLAASREPGAWNRGYLHIANGVCLVVGDALYFYVSGWSGASPKSQASMYAGGSTGLAVLRRDGFSSMDAGEQPGTLTTRPVTFTGRHLFVNVDNPQGELRVDVLDENDQPMAPFTADRCHAIQTDATRCAVRWDGADDLGALIDRPVRLRFHLTRGRLYAFWVSANAGGASDGYIGAGGPGFNGARDGRA